MKTMSKGQIEYLKKQYPPSTRICLDSMGDDPCPLPLKAKGTVIAVDDLGTLHCEFDCGRSLGVCPDVDKFHKLSEQRESQEPKMSM